MSRYQQEQAGWEMRDQEDEHWYVKNIRDPESIASIDKLVTAQPIINQMLSSFDSIFGTSDKESI